MNPAPLVEVDRQVFAAYFNRKPFRVRHSLPGHPLFELPRLLELARALPERFVEYNAGAVPVGVRPEETPRTGLSAMQRTTAFPASIIAQTMARNLTTQKGAVPQERCVPAAAFIEALAARDIKVSESVF